VDRTLTTQHGRLDLADLAPFYAAFPDLPLAAVSHDQRRYLRHANWVGTVHHGLPRDLLAFQPKAGGYLAFLGRIAPEKGPNRAIEIAARSGMPLKIAAKVDRVDQAYWEEQIRPMVESHANVEFVGEIAESEKSEFLGKAAALLFPVDWPEPFGLVTIEAMACGTPVIAFRRGSVPEIVTDGVSGYIVDTVEEAVAAVRRITTLDRAKVRAEFERRFTVERMAREYLEIYQAVAVAPAEAAMIRGRAGKKATRTYPLKRPAHANESSVQANEPQGRPAASSLASLEEAIAESSVRQGLQ
jgi:glycosyltransferase involved in cell wall biosynthesis